MIRCSVTVSLVEAARGGPFVFWHDLEFACTYAKVQGYHGIEVLPASAADVSRRDLHQLLGRADLDLAAVGTSGGSLCSGLSLTSPDPEVRAQAIAFVREIIDLGAEFGAPALVDSMQGRWGGDVSRHQALEWLRGALSELGAHAVARGTKVLFEPLNRYETNLVNTLADGANFVASLSTDGVGLAADLFHMNIEEADMAASIRRAGALIEHVHFADSNRAAVGAGHIQIVPIVTALRETGFDGFVCANALPEPDSENAARLTIESYRRYFGGAS